MSETSYNYLLCIIMSVKIYLKCSETVENLVAGPGIKHATPPFPDKCSPTELPDGRLFLGNRANLNCR